MKRYVLAIKLGVETLYTEINADCDEVAIKMSDEKLDGHDGELTHGAWKEKRLVKRYAK